MPTRLFARKRFLVASLGIALLPWVCMAEGPGLTRHVLTNHDVITLANAGFSEEFIVQTIASSRTKFDLTADALADLAKHAITEDIIRTMSSASTQGPSVPGETAAPKRGETASGQARSNRVFVESSPNSWSLSLSHPQTVEIMKTFGQSCPNLVVTDRKADAMFTVALERESGKLLRRDNKMVVFDRTGDVVYVASTRLLGNAVRDFCTSAQSGAGTK
ncbi:MAG: hypothetical protein LAP39_10245 [Acidobacteriia bacterium]|nr:hypothetical protein [Terriglobia bacterium]